MGHAHVRTDSGTPPPREWSDRELIARVRRGDVRAFEQIFRTYYELLVAFAHGYVRSRETAEEIVQDVMLNVWEHRAMWVIHAGVRPYLYRATRNQALNRLKHARVARRFADAFRRDHDGTVPAADDAQERLEAGELAAAVQRAIGDLPLRCRQVFVLRSQHGLSHAEIAAVMGTTVKTVQIQMGKARRLLRRALAGWIGGEMTGA